MEELKKQIHFVSVSIAQYQIESQISLDSYEFRDKKKFRSFFTQFATYANERWQEKTGEEWDFGKFPFRKSRDTIKGLFRILKTGGTYTTDEGEPYSEDAALKIEEYHRKKLQKDAQSLIIFCNILEDTCGEDLSSGRDAQTKRYYFYIL